MDIIDTDQSKIVVLDVDNHVWIYYDGYWNNQNQFYRLQTISDIDYNYGPVRVFVEQVRS